MGGFTVLALQSTIPLDTASCPGGRIPPPGACVLSIRSRWFLPWICSRSKTRRPPRHTGSFAKLGGPPWTPLTVHPPRSRRPPRSAPRCVSVAGGVVSRTVACCDVRLPQARPTLIIGNQRSCRDEPLVSAQMWIVVTSDGRRVAGICSETDARRAVHRLGVTQLRGPFSWDVVDNLGRSFVAEIKHRAGRQS